MLTRDKPMKVVMLLWVMVMMKASGQAKVPAPLSSYLVADKNYQGEIITVVPPKEIEEYIEKVKERASKNPEWFAEYSENAKPGVPLPYHENLGLSEKEYAEYRALWDKREFKVLQKVGVRLEQVGDQWRILVSGAGAKISLLRFNPADGTVISTSGKMERLEDIDAAPETILGAWKGAEWRFEDQNGLGTTKENFAVGKTADKKHGMLVYRLQDVTATGKVLFDQSVVVRFVL